MELLDSILLVVVYHFHLLAVLVVLPLAVWLTVCAVRWGRQSRRLACAGMLAGTTLLIALSAAVFCYQPRVRYRMDRSSQPAALAAAIHTYCQQHKSLPHSLEPLQASGLYGSTPYLRPLPWYLPAQDWDEQTPFILAVEARTEHTAGRRAYIVAGRTDAQWADDETLAELLARDDALRRSHNQPRLWNSLPWRQIVPAK